MSYTTIEQIVDEAVERAGCYYTEQLASDGVNDPAASVRYSYGKPPVALVERLGKIAQVFADIATDHTLDDLSAQDVRLLLVTDPSFAPQVTVGNELDVGLRAAVRSRVRERVLSAIADTMVHLA